MNKQLTLNLDAFLGPPKPSSLIDMLIGLSGWKKTEDDPPPFIGWWKTWSEFDAHQRRWWNGYEWSIPVHLGTTCGVAQDAAETPTKQDSSAIVWCGLLREHPAGYFEYRLVRSPRVRHWEQMHANTP